MVGAASLVPRISAAPSQITPPTIGLCRRKKNENSESHCEDQIELERGTVADFPEGSNVSVRIPGYSLRVSNGTRQKFKLSREEDTTGRLGRTERINHGQVRWPGTAAARRNRFD